MASATCNSQCWAARNNWADISGLSGSWKPGRTAIFIPAKDASNNLCGLANKEANDLCAHLNSIRARGE